MYEKAFQQRWGEGREGGGCGVRPRGDERNTKTGIVDAPQFASWFALHQSTIPRRHEAETAVPGHRLGVVDGRDADRDELGRPNLTQALAKYSNVESTVVRRWRLPNVNLVGWASQGIASKRDVVRS